MLGVIMMGVRCWRFPRGGRFDSFSGVVVFWVGRSIYLS